MRLAEVFRKMFITRVGHRLRRDKLIWPTRSMLPQSDCHQALGLSSHEQMLWLCGPERGESLKDESDQPSAPSTSDVPTDPISDSPESEQANTPIRPRKRDLTAQERVFLKQLRATNWIVDCQVTPPGYEGPKRAISYLARYVAGVAISDQRLVSDSGGMVTISYKVPS